MLSQEAYLELFTLESIVIVCLLQLAVRNMLELGLQNKLIDKKVPPQLN
jgi:hypothetical protein